MKFAWTEATMAKDEEPSFWTLIFASFGLTSTSAILIWFKKGEGLVKFLDLSNKYIQRVIPTVFASWKSLRYVWNDALAMISFFFLIFFFNKELVAILGSVFNFSFAVLFAFITRFLLSTWVEGNCFCEGWRKECGLMMFFLWVLWIKFGKWGQACYHLTFWATSTLSVQPQSQTLKTLKTNQDKRRT